jgi:hypothetical protein
MWSSRWDDNWQEKSKYSEKSCLGATLATTNATLPDLGSNLGHHSGKPASDCMSYKTPPYDKRLVAGFPLRRPGFDPGSGHVGFVVDKVAPGQVFSEYFDFSCQFSFHRLLHIHHLSSVAGTIGQSVAAVPNGPSFTPPPLSELKKINRMNYGTAYTAVKPGATIID